MEIFHSTKESWRCLGDSGESTGGHSSLRQQASGKKGNLPYRAHKINTFICLRRIIFLPFLPSLPSPAFEASTCRDNQFSAGCHSAVWPSLIFSCKQKKRLTHWLMGVREKWAHLAILRPEEFRDLQPNTIILHIFNVYMKPSNTDWISTLWIAILSSLLTPVHFHLYLSKDFPVAKKQNQTQPKQPIWLLNHLLFISVSKQKPTSSKGWASRRDFLEISHPLLSRTTPETRGALTSVHVLGRHDAWL